MVDLITVGVLINLVVQRRLVTKMLNYIMLDFREEDLYLKGLLMQLLGSPVTGSTVSTSSGISHPCLPKPARGH